MWLPELACNDAVLALLIDEGLRFVILAPHQAARVRSNRTVIPAFQGGTDIPVCHHEGNPSTENQWQNVLDGTIDTSIAYQYFHRDGSGRSLAVVFYDDEISRAIAFEQALTSSSSLVDRFERRRIGKGDLLSIATDGESYGHHHKFGDLCLAHTLNIEAPSRGFRVTNFGEYFDQYPPTKEVEISAGPAGEGTSWSCPHGVSRWIRDCGCQTDGEPGWNQAWRQPLRKAFDFVRDEAAKYFEETRGRLFVDPWSARNEAIELILDPFKSREEFLQRQAPTFLNSEEQKRALGFLELQRNTMLMYTSCAWFFNDISGLEPIQILKYASRSIDLMNQLGLPPVRDRFLEILAEARSNRPQDGNGADIYKRFVEPASPSFDLNSKKLSGMPA
jgi:alpha-amylase/alpha-mannosidase (GH57 family)